MPTINTGFTTVTIPDIAPTLVLESVNTVYTGLGLRKLEFELADEMFEDGYTNDIVPSSISYALTHDPGFRWKGGRFDDINIQLLLVAGVHKEIKTAKVLSDHLLVLQKWALIEDVLFHVPIRLRLKVGKWFVREGFIKNLKIRRKQPYEAITGLPMVAEVNIVFLTDFGTVIGTQNGRLTRSYNEKRLPTAKNFTWEFTGRGQ